MNQPARREEKRRKKTDGKKRFAERLAEKVKISGNYEWTPNHDGIIVRNKRIIGKEGDFGIAYDSFRRNMRDLGFRIHRQSQTEEDSEDENHKRTTTHVSDENEQRPGGQQMAGRPLGTYDDYWLFRDGDHFKVDDPNAKLASMICNDTNLRTSNPKIDWERKGASTDDSGSNDACQLAVDTQQGTAVDARAPSMISEQGNDGDGSEDGTMPPPFATIPPQENAGSNKNNAKSVAPYALKRKSPPAAPAFQFYSAARPLDGEGLYFDGKWDGEGSTNDLTELGSFGDADFNLEDATEVISAWGSTTDLLSVAEKRFWAAVKACYSKSYDQILCQASDRKFLSSQLKSRVAVATFTAFANRLDLLYKISDCTNLSPKLPAYATFWRQPPEETRQSIGGGDCSFGLRSFNVHSYVQDEFQNNMLPEMRNPSPSENQYGVSDDATTRSEFSLHRDWMKQKLQDLLDAHHEVLQKNDKDDKDDPEAAATAILAVAEQLELLQRLSFDFAVKMDSSERTPESKSKRTTAPMKKASKSTTSAVVCRQDVSCGEKFVCLQQHQTSDTPKSPKDTIDTLVSGLHADSDAFRCIQTCLPFKVAMGVLQNWFISNDHDSKTNLKRLETVLNNSVEAYYDLKNPVARIVAASFEICATYHSDCFSLSDMRKGKREAQRIMRRTIHDLSETPKNFWGCGGRGVRDLCRKTILDSFCKLSYLVYSLEPRSENSSHPRFPELVSAVERSGKHSDEYEYLAHHLFHPDHNSASKDEGGRVTDTQLQGLEDDKEDRELVPTANRTQGRGHFGASKARSPLRTTNRKDLGGVLACRKSISSLNTFPSSSMTSLPWAEAAANDESARGISHEPEGGVSMANGNDDDSQVSPAATESEVSAGCVPPSAAAVDVQENQNGTVQHRDDGNLNEVLNCDVSGSVERTAAEGKTSVGDSRKWHDFLFPRQRPVMFRKPPTKIFFPRNDKQERNKKPIGCAEVGTKICGQMEETPLHKPGDIGHDHLRIREDEGQSNEKENSSAGTVEEERSNNKQNEAAPGDDNLFQSVEDVNLMTTREGMQIVKPKFPNLSAIAPVDSGIEEDEAPSEVLHASQSSSGDPEDRRASGSHMLIAETSAAARLVDLNAGVVSTRRSSNLADVADVETRQEEEQRRLGGTKQGQAVTDELEDESDENGDAAKAKVSLVRSMLGENCPISQTESVKQSQASDGYGHDLGLSKVSECPSLLSLVKSAYWSTLPPMRQRRSGFAVAMSHDGKFLYVAGGVDSENQELANAEALNLETKQWSFIPPLKAARQDCAGVYLSSGGGLFVVIGGYSEEMQYLDSVEAYDPAQRVWKLFPSLQQKRRGHAAAVVGPNRVFVVGGNCRGAELRSTEIFDSDGSKSWVTITPQMKKRRDLCAAITVRRDGNGDNLMVLGGSNTGTRYKSVECLDTCRFEWATRSSNRMSRFISKLPESGLANMSETRDGLAAVAFSHGSRDKSSSFVAVIGGSNGPRLRERVEFYDVARNEWLTDRDLAKSLGMQAFEHVSNERDCREECPSSRPQDRFNGGAVYVPPSRDHRTDNINEFGPLASARSLAIVTRSPHTSDSLRSASSSTTNASSSSDRDTHRIIVLGGRDNRGNVLKSVSMLTLQFWEQHNAELPEVTETTRLPCSCSSEVAEGEDNPNTSQLSGESLAVVEGKEDPVDKQNNESDDFLKLLTNFETVCHPNLVKLLSLISSVHHMSLYYTAVATLFRLGLLNFSERNHYIKKGLEQTANTITSYVEAGHWKRILIKAREDGVVVDEGDLHQLELRGDRRVVEESGRLRDMRSTLLLDEGNIRNFRCVTNELTDLRQERVNTAVTFLCTVLNGVSLAFRGGNLNFTETMFGRIVDFGDVAHMREVAITSGNIELIETMRRCPEDGGDVCRLNEEERLNPLVAVFAAAVATRHSADQWNRRTRLKSPNAASLMGGGESQPTSTHRATTLTPATSPTAGQARTAKNLEELLPSSDDDTLDSSSTGNPGDIMNLVQKALPELEAHVLDSYTDRLSEAGFDDLSIILEGHLSEDDLDFMEKDHRKALMQHLERQTEALPFQRGGRFMDDNDYSDDDV